MVIKLLKITNKCIFLIEKTTNDMLSDLLDCLAKKIIKQSNSVILYNRINYSEFIRDNKLDILLNLNKLPCLLLIKNGKVKKVVNGFQYIANKIKF